jgi:hypothetical protein
MISQIADWMRFYNAKIQNEDNNLEKKQSVSGCSEKLYKTPW